MPGLPSEFAIEALVHLIRGLPRVSTIVEIGGGLASCQNLLVSFCPGAECISFDISDEAQASNRQRFSLGRYLVGDVREGLEQPDNSAEFVHSSHLIEHLEEPYQLIEEQLRICKPGGMAVFVAPLHMHHREHRQVLAIGDVVGMLKDYANPVLCHVDGRETEIVAGIFKP